ncbi:outer membrane lipoprotein-sorting protein [Rhodoferax fermentans]|uniref:Outer membrane lipoprotein-sorting protein n=1 Tax=Rhodoferax fermentans TaxID=28066 RepID=A0A1T1ATH3_RHOFE|nr:outer membrane lipoprotein-sorting protein [Rhodoferax fermentans]OOV07268.1 outer membrane lipoprotein-sorting protein [Rhodoferax fermentans]
MKLHQLSLFLLGALLSACALAQGAPQPNAQAMLQASDAVRNPDKPFGVTVTLIEYRSGKQTDTSTLGSYAKSDARSGQFRTLIRFVAPARDEGKLMLKNGNDFWFYDPSSRASVRLSPQQRLMGQASNGDVVTVNLAKDYQAKIGLEEEIADGNRQMRRSTRLDLTASSPEASYNRIELWVDSTNSQPLKARFFSESERLLKTVYYRRYQPQLGKERPTEMVIIDGLDTKWVTVMRYSDFVYRDVPEVWLQRDYLPNFKPE